jgi:hypothetical protein
LPEPVVCQSVFSSLGLEKEQTIVTFPKHNIRPTSRRKDVVEQHKHYLASWWPLEASIHVNNSRGCSMRWPRIGRNGHLGRFNDVSLAHES